MTGTGPLLFEREDGIARLTLDRPTAGNAIDLELARALMEAAIQCDEDESVRCVVLTGRGRFFCAGGDIGEFAAAGASAGALLKALTGYLHLAISRLVRMDKPLISVVNGPAAGAGIGLAVLGDLVLAARSAHFTLAYAGIGLSPDGGCTWLLPRLIGLRRAQELIMTNRRVGAEEAVQLGLATRVVEDADLPAEAASLGRQMGHSAVSALGHARRLLLQSFDSSVETQMEAEARSIAELTRTADAQEGITAFREKRKPVYPARR